MTTVKLQRAIAPDILDLASDVYEFAPLVRDADVAECVAHGYPGARAALLASLESSNIAFAARFDDEVAAMWGLVSLPWASCLWLITGRAVDRAPLSFFRLAKAALVPLLERAVDHTLVQAIPATYLGALRLAESLGFDVGEPQPLGPKGVPFRVVHLRRA